MSDRETQRSGNPWKVLWKVGVILCLAGLVLGAWILTRSQTVLPTEPINTPNDGSLIELSLEAQRSAKLKIVHVEKRPLERTLAATGVVAPDQNRLAHIRPLARGVAEEILVQLGDRVQGGDPLLRYDNIELGEFIGEYLTLQAEIEREQAQAEVSRSYLARAESLLAVEAIAQREYELRDAQYKQAVAVVESKKAELARVEEKIHRLGMSDEDLRGLGGSEHGTHRTASHNVLRAPIAGVITMQDVAVGEILEPAREVFTLTDISVVWVLADIYEKDLGKVEVGQTARVRVPAYPQEVFTGKVTYIGDVLDPESRTSKLRCVVANPDRRLKLEMFATIEIPSGATSEVLAVPSAAIQQIDSRPVVFVQRSATDFQKSVVETGGESDGWIEIRSGLRAGEPVVAEGSFYLKSALLRELIGGEE